MSYTNAENIHDDKGKNHAGIPHGGEVLIASPLLKDPNFSRTVILILEQDAKRGHIGLVLNRELNISMQDICNLAAPAGNAKVYQGGPVDLQRLFWLHSLGDKLPGSVEILPGLYVGGNYDDLLTLIDSGFDLKGKIRFYLGYAGWDAGQVADEIRMDAWHAALVPDPRYLITASSDSLWSDLVRMLGPDFRHWLIIPQDPAQN